jgi:hypothetical protein
MYDLMQQLQSERNRLILHSRRTNCSVKRIEIVVHSLSRFAKYLLALSRYSGVRDPWDRFFSSCFVMSSAVWYIIYYSLTS